MPYPEEEAKSMVHQIFSYKFNDEVGVHDTRLTNPIEQDALEAIQRLHHKANDLQTEATYREAVPNQRDKAVIEAINTFVAAARVERELGNVANAP